MFENDALAPRSTPFSNKTSPTRASALHLCRFNFNINFEITDQVIKHITYGWEFNCFTAFGNIYTDQNSSGSRQRPSNRLLIDLVLFIKSQRFPMNIYKSGRWRLTCVVPFSPAPRSTLEPRMEMKQWHTSVHDWRPPQPPLGTRYR